MYATLAEPCWVTSFTKADRRGSVAPGRQRSAEVWALLTEIAAPEPDALGGKATDLPDELRHALDGWLAARSL
jgi:hypothetical protein